MSNADGRILKAYERHLGSRYARFLERMGLDDTIDEASGAFLRTSDGRELIDFVAGYGVFNFGHNPPDVVEALRAELDALPLWNRPFLSQRFAETTERLVSLTPDGLDRVLLTSTGTEAVESALKLARLSRRNSKIIATRGGFHGFTLGALSVSGIPSQTRPFRPLLSGVEHVAFGDAQAMEEALDQETAAVILEPIQAEIGAIEPCDGYLSDVRELCDRYGALLIVDEIRTGMGRTGPLLAIEEEGATPDMLLMGKALAAGIAPIGALVGSSSIWDKVGVSFAMTASSFSGNRLSCAASLATMNLIESTDPFRRGRRNAQILTRALKGLAESMPEFIEKVTGRGLLLGVHFQSRTVAADVAERCIASGLLVGQAFCDRRCLLLEPPLVMNSETTREGIQLLREACVEIAREGT